MEATRLTCCDLTVPEANADVVDGNQAAFPEVPADAGEHQLRWSRRNETFTPPSLQDSTCHVRARNLGQHRLHEGDLHLRPHRLGVVGQTPDLLHRHVVLVVDVENQGVVHFPGGLQQVVEPHAVPVVPRQVRAVKTAHVAGRGGEEHVSQEEAACKTQRASSQRGGACSCESADVGRCW